MSHHRARGSSRANSLKFALPIACGLIVAFGLTGCSRSNAGTQQGPPAMPVKVEAVKDQPIGDASEYVATIKSRHSATIMSDVEGWIFDIHVHSGQLVKKGDTLMEIDPRRQQATVSNYDSQKAFQRSGAGLGQVAIRAHQGAGRQRRDQPAGSGAGAVEL